MEKFDFNNPIVVKSGQTFTTETDYKLIVNQSSTSSFSSQIGNTYYNSAYIYRDTYDNTHLYYLSVNATVPKGITIKPTGLNVVIMPRVED